MSKKKYLIIIAIAIPLIFYGSLHLYLSSFVVPESSGGTLWSIDYEKPTETFPKKLVNQKLSEIFNDEQTQNYMKHFKTPSEYWEWFPVNETLGHTYNENTHGLYLEGRYGSNQQYVQIVKTLEEIPGITKVTLVSEAVP